MKRTMFGEVPILKSVVYSSSGEYSSKAHCKSQYVQVHLTEGYPKVFNVYVLGAAEQAP